MLCVELIREYGNAFLPELSLREFDRDLEVILHLARQSKIRLISDSKGSDFISLILTF